MAKIDTKNRNIYLSVQNKLTTISNNTQIASDHFKKLIKELDNIKKTVLAGVGLILFIELTQLLCPERHTDIDDVILNTCGVLIGAYIVFAIRRNLIDTGAKMRKV